MIKYLIKTYKQRKHNNLVRKVAKNYYKYVVDNFKDISGEGYTKWFVCGSHNIYGYPLGSQKVVPDTSIENLVLNATLDFLYKAQEKPALLDLMYGGVLKSSKSSIIINNCVSHSVTNSKPT